MKLTRTWIDTNLTPKEREQLVDWLMERSANPTGELIQQGLLELWPVLDETVPSVVSCLNWKNKAWPWELQRRSLREDVQVAKILTDAAGQGDFAAANRELAESVLFDQLRAVKAGNLADLNPKALSAMMRGVAALAKSSRDEIELTVRLRALQIDSAKAILAKSREVNAIVQNKSLSEGDQIDAIRRVLYGDDYVEAVAAGLEEGGAA